MPFEGTERASGLPWRAGVVMGAAPLMIGSETSAVRELASALASDWLAFPGQEASLEAWRARESAGEQRARLVVAPWRDRKSVV